MIIQNLKGGCIKTSMHKICFVGSNYKDFVFYMALLLNNLEKRVLINDKSLGQDFMAMFSEYDLNERLLTYRNIDIYFGEYRDGNYDFILDYIGDLKYLESSGSYSYIVVNSSMGRQEIFDNLKQIACLQKETIFVIRDTTGGGKDRKYLKQNYMKYMTFISCLYEIPLDYMDKDYQTEMDYRGFIRFKYLSQKYCKTLIKIAVMFTGKQEPMVEKALKYAKEGRILDNRILE